MISTFSLRQTALWTFFCLISFCALQPYSTSRADTPFDLKTYSKNIVEGHYHQAVTQLRAAIEADNIGPENYSLLLDAGILAGDYQDTKTFGFITRKLVDLRKSEPDPETRLRLGAYTNAILLHYPSHEGRDDPQWANFLLTTPLPPMSYGEDHLILFALADNLGAHGRYREADNILHNLLVKAAASGHLYPHQAIELLARLANAYQASGRTLLAEKALNGVDQLLAKTSSAITMPSLRLAIAELTLTVVMRTNFTAAHKLIALQDALLTQNIDHPPQALFFHFLSKGYLAALEGKPSDIDDIVTQMRRYAGNTTFPYFAPMMELSQAYGRLIMGDAGGLKNISPATLQSDILADVGTNSLITLLRTEVYAALRDDKMLLSALNTLAQEITRLNQNAAQSLSTSNDADMLDDFFKWRLFFIYDAASDHLKRELAPVIFHILSLLDASGADFDLYTRAQYQLHAQEDFRSSLKHYANQSHGRDLFAGRMIDRVSAQTQAFSQRNYAYDERLTNPALLPNFQQAERNFLRARENIEKYEPKFFDNAFSSGLNVSDPQKTLKDNQTLHYYSFGGPFISRCAITKETVECESEKVDMRALQSRVDRLRKSVISRNMAGDTASDAQAISSALFGVSGKTGGGSFRDPGTPSLGPALSRPLCRSKNQSCAGAQSRLLKDSRQIIASQE